MQLLYVWWKQWREKTLISPTSSRVGIWTQFMSTYEKPLWALHGDPTPQSTSSHLSWFWWKNMLLLDANASKIRPSVLAIFESCLCRSIFSCYCHKSFVGRHGQLDTSRFGQSQDYPLVLKFSLQCRPYKTHQWSSFRCLYVWDFAQSRISHPLFLSYLLPRLPTQCWCARWQKSL